MRYTRSVSDDRFDAFISYSHAADRPLAKAVQRHLHRLGRAWYRPAALRVFRDDTTLTASPDLWASIEEGLTASRTLVLLASPEAAASPWVDRELQWWQQHRGPDSLFIVLTSGELAWNPAIADFDIDRATALPPRLRSYFKTEPLWVDLRRHQGKAERRDKAAMLAAAVHGVPKDRLLSEDLQRQRQLITVLSTLLVIVLIAAGTAVWQRGVAIGERDRADQQARVAISRALAAESDNRTVTDPQLASQFAVAAFDAATTPEAKGAVARQFDRNRHLGAYVSRGGDLGPDVSQAALSADGSLVAYVIYGDPLGRAEVVLWDPKSKKELGRLALREASDPVDEAAQERETAEALALTKASVALDATGQRLAVDDGSRIQVWDVPARKLLRTLGVDDDTRLVMSPDGEWVARTKSEGIDHTLQMWRTDTGGEVAGAGALQLSEDQIGFAPDNQVHALSGSFQEGRVEQFDPVTGQWTRPPLTANTPAWALGVSRNGAFLATSMSDYLSEPAGGQMAVTTRNLATGSWAKRSLPSMTIESLVVSDDGETVVVQEGRRLIAVEMSTGLLTDLTQHRDGIKSVSATGDAGSLVSVDYDSDVFLSHRTDNRAGVGPFVPEGRRLDNIYALAAGSGGHLAAVARGHGEIELWELPGLRLRLTLPVLTDDDPRSTYLAISDDGNRVAAVVNSELIVADAGSGQVLARDLPALAGLKVRQARFAANGRLLVTTYDEDPGRDQVLRVIDMADGSEEQTVRLRVSRDDEGSTLDVSDGGEYVAAITSEFEVTILRWTGTTYEQLTKIDDRRSSTGIYDVALDPKGSRVAFAGQGDRIVTAKVEDPHEKRALPVADTGGFQDSLVRLAFTSDGVLAQASHSFGGFGGIALVDPDSGVLLATWLDDRELPEGQWWVGGKSDVMVDRGDGKAVPGTSLDGRLLHWHLDIDAMRQQLCALAGPLPQDERDRFTGGVDIGPACRSS